MTRILICVFLILAFSSFGYYSYTQYEFVEPKYVESDGQAKSADAPASIKRMPPFKYFVIGGKRFEFETVRLDEVIRYAGRNTILNIGDASEAVAWACYSVFLKSRPYKIIINSSELGGGEYVDGIIIRPYGIDIFSILRCPILSNQKSKVTLGSQLSIGTDRKRLENALGKPTQASDGLFEYSFDFETSESAKVSYLKYKASSENIFYIDYWTSTQ